MAPPVGRECALAGRFVGEGKPPLLDVLDPEPDNALAPQ